MYYVIKYSIIIFVIVIFIMNMWLAFYKNEYFLVLNNIPLWFFLETFFFEKYAPFKD